MGKLERRKKLAVFDMDGTLFDTDEANCLAYQDAAQKAGITIDRGDFLEKAAGENYRDFLPLFGADTDAMMEQIHEEKKRIYPEYAEKVRMNQHLFEIIRCIRREYQIGLVTTASKKNTEDLLGKFEVREYFDFIISQEDVERLKPDPECYIQAMKKAKVFPEDMIIFEDSEIGVEAAVKSGGAVFRIERF